MTSCIWIKNTLTTKIYKEFADKYILITANAADFDVNAVVMYLRTPNTYVCLGEVISIKNNKIAIQKLDVVGNHSKSKMMKILTEQEYLLK